MLGLHVVLAIDRAGLVGEDGETHHGIFDVGFLRQAPGMLLLAPASTAELQAMLQWASLTYTGPVAIRYPRGGNGEYSDAHWTPDSGVITHRQEALLPSLLTENLSITRLQLQNWQRLTGSPFRWFALPAFTPLPTTNCLLPSTA